MVLAAAAATAVSAVMASTAQFDDELQFVLQLFDLLQVCYLRFDDLLQTCMHFDIVKLCCRHIS